MQHRLSPSLFLSEGIKYKAFNFFPTERERERERERQAGRQADRQTERQTDRQTDRVCACVYVRGRDRCLFLFLSGPAQLVLNVGSTYVVPSVALRGHAHAVQSCADVKQQHQHQPPYNSAYLAQAKVMPELFTEPQLMDP